MIALQGVGLQSALAVRERDARLQQVGGGVIARAQGVSDDLAGASAQGQPKPDHATPPVAHEAPEFIKFQHFLGLGRCQGGFQGSQILGFF